MKNSLFIFILVFSSWASGIGQSFTLQSLNKGASYANTAQLQDYDGDGDLDIILAQTAPYPGIVWLENEPTQQFPLRNLVTENIVRIHDLDLGDFDKDGDIDYLVCMGTAVGTALNGELAWFQRQDNGKFIKWTLDTDDDFTMAEVADFDGDGWLDVAALGLKSFTDGVKLYINEKNFFFKESLLATDDVGGALDAGDVDKDGDIDLVVGGSGLVQSNDGARLLINNGKASFSAQFKLHCWGDNYNDCGSVGNMLITDINGDGVNDILGFSITGTGGLYWLNGAANFDQKLIDDDNAIDLGGDILVFDADGNGRKDIIRQGYGKERMSILYQTGNMVFEREYLELKWDNGGNPIAKMAAGDLDKDGDIDIIFPEKGNIDGDVSWFENIKGKFYRHLLRSELKGARIPKFADADKDGDLDIFLTVSSDLGEEEDEVVLYENRGGGNFVNWRLNDDLDYAADVEPADIDGDGDMDAFATGRNANDLIWMRNDGLNGNWPSIKIDDNPNTPLGIEAVDLDLDKDMDVVICPINEDKVFWYRNNGKGEFTKQVVDADVDAPREIEAADLDKDGDIDLALVCGSTLSTVTVYLNNGSQGFSKSTAFSGELGSDIEVADWDADGDMDIIFSIQNDAPADPRVEVVLLRNSGKGSFSTENLIVNAESGRSLRVIDLDGDKDLDLLIGRKGQAVLVAWIRASNSNNTMRQVILAQYSSGSGECAGIDVADVDGDGLNEIVFSEFQNDALYLVRFNCFTGPDLSSKVQKATCGENNGAVQVIPNGSGNFTYLWSNGSTTQSINGLRTGPYSVTVTSYPGCSSTLSAVVSREAIATVSLSPTPTTCDKQDGKIEVLAQGGSPIKKYLWSNGSTNNGISNLAAGLYSVTLTDTNICQIIREVSVPGRSKPVFSLGKDTVITSGKTLILSTGGNNQWQYMWSSGQTTASISVNGPGVYSVTVSNQEGCVATDTIVVRIATALHDPFMVKDFEVYPNPSRDIFVLNTASKQLHGAQMRIVNASGQLMSEQIPSWSGNSSEAISVNHLASGFYWIELHKGTYWARAKLVVAH